MFAFNNELPVFFSEAERPFRFDYVESGLDLSCLRLKNSTQTLKTIEGEIKVGAPQELLWERLMFVLSYVGKIPLAHLCKSMRYTGETLVFSDDYAKIAEISFNYCYYFGDKNCRKLLCENPVDNSSYICYDWIAFNRGGKHDIDFIETEDEFVKSIWFYPSDRIDGNSPIKDACVVSHLTKQQLLDFDHSETMARFKMIYEMEKRGMKGKFNGYGPNGKSKYYKFRTSTICRRKQKETEALKDNNLTENQSKIEITKVKKEDLYRDLSTSYVGYDRFLRNF